MAIAIIVLCEGLRPVITEGKGNNDEPKFFAIIEDSCIKDSLTKFATFPQYLNQILPLLKFQ
jgi:hypothetical protein